MSNKPFDPYEWPASKFSLQYDPWITRIKDMITKLSVVEQILRVNILGNV